MKSKARVLAAAAVFLISVLPVTEVNAQSEAHEVAPTFHGKSRWFKNHYDSNYRYACPVAKSDKQTWAKWVWSNMPAGYYRIEVYIPPHEATAVVTYNIRSNGNDPVVDPVQLVQAEKRGRWATVANFNYGGGQLWLTLSNHGTRSSGAYDWCSWGGDHSIGAANARLISIDESDMTASSEPLEPGSYIEQEGNNYDRTLSPFYEDLYAQYIEQSPNGGMCEEWSTRRKPSTNKLWILTYPWYAFYLGECTSWVQFRVRGTVLAEFDNGYGRGESGGGIWGHAGQWDNIASKLGGLGVKVTQTPNKFAVAQWKPGRISGTSIGHVAFVEAVSEDGNTIWVSEMNQNNVILCYVSVRSIVRGTPAWPDKFIQFGEV
ncbi:CHAP domain-containing protein [Candidatus Poriferisocius sp.]|uniref:CHAP domain-containing protein n=1 Tax=Candidatus Poriferisocius sp. TaxID=3101276 RepID=UPI003B0224E5